MRAITVLKESLLAQRPLTKACVQAPPRQPHQRLWRWLVTNNPGIQIAVDWQSRKSCGHLQKFA